RDRKLQPRQEVAARRLKKATPTAGARRRAIGAARPPAPAGPAGRVVAIAGAGPAFCAGHDLKEMRARPDQSYYRELFQRCSHMMLTITQMPQPVIARVHGIATAAGCQLVATCDLAVGTPEARFATSGINVGLFCSTPAVALNRNVSQKQSFEMLMTGDFIDADTALRYGLLNRVVAADELDKAVADLAGAIAAKSFAAVAVGKRLFYRQRRLDLSAPHDASAQTMARHMMTPDARA